MRRATGPLPYSAAATVKTHARHIYAKLGTHSRAEPDALVDAPNRPEGPTAVPSVAEGRAGDAFAALRSPWFPYLLFLCNKLR